MKKCTSCQADKPKSDFYRHNKSPDGLEYKCKSCKSSYQKLWFKLNPDKKRANQRKYKYGMDNNTFLTLLHQQDRKCAICKKPNKNKRDWHIDHCHNTGLIRGILCHNCNTALGLLRDDLSVVEQMAKYLATSNKR